MTSNPLPLPAGLRDRLDPRTLGLFAAGAVLVALIWVVARWASATPYVTLYHDLELKDVATITDRLQKADIEHRLGPSGTEVLVPPEELARARVALAKDGLPSSGRPGLELFDRTSWGMTDFTQRVTYQRALEGELARTIAGLRGVQSAQVHLVLSEHGGFRSSDRPGSASVVVTLAAGTALPDETVRGITYVVSNSVEGLASDDVAVMDDGGHVLSTPADAGTAGGLTSRQLDLQRTVERQLSEKIESMLATVVGQGRARAQVSALLGFDQVDRTEETYDPETQVLQLEQRSEGGEPPNPGTVVSNTYQNSRMVERRSAAVGEVERLTVAVLVDDEAMRSAPAPLRGADGIARLEAMVRDAAGLDTTRGDRLTVMAVPFEKVMPAEAGTRAENAAKGPSPIVIVERWSRPAAGLLALVVLALLAFRVVAGGAPARAPDGMPAGAALGAGGPLAGGAPDGGRNGANGNRTDEAARVMRAWLEDRR